MEHSAGSGERDAPASRHWQVATALPADVDLRTVPALARALESLGVDVLHVPETVHDSFLVAALALTATSTLRVRTSLTVALPRSPMVVAYAAWDLATLSGGRFELGLGSQVRGNIVDRFSTPWIDPAAQMGDHLASVRAIFEAFVSGEPLHHEGPFYRFTRLQPIFRPADHGHGIPKLATGGVGPKMCAMAGAQADIFVTHPTSAHPAMVREQLRPGVAKGARAAGRPMPTMTIVPWCVTGADPASVAAEGARMRRELAPLFSTPAYHRTLDLLGYADVGPRLQALVRQGRWADLDAAMPAALLEELLLTAPYEELAARLTSRYAGLGDTLAVPIPASLLAAAADLAADPSADPTADPAADPSADSAAMRRSAPVQAWAEALAQVRGTLLSPGE